MKNIISLAVILFFITACNNNNKSTTAERKDTSATKDTAVQKPIVGGDVDEHGCKPSAGYRWSIIKNKCIRVFEDGIKLSPQEAVADKTVAAYVVFSEDNNKAELFLPANKTSFILERKAEGQPWVKDEWSLAAWKGYVLKKNDVLLYAGE